MRLNHMPWCLLWVVSRDIVKFGLASTLRGNFFHDLKDQLSNQDEFHIPSISSKSKEDYYNYPLLPPNSAADIRGMEYPFYSESGRNLDYVIPIYSNSTSASFVLETGAKVSLTVLFLLFMAGFVVFRYWDRWDHDYIIYVLKDEKIIKLHQSFQNKKGDFHRKLDTTIRSVSASVASKGEEKKKVQFVSDVLKNKDLLPSNREVYKTASTAFFDDAMLSKYLLEDLSLYQMILHAVSHRHEYLNGTLLGPFFGYSLRQTRMLRWLCVGYTLLAVIFVSTLYFQHFFPDDGYCESHSTETACYRPYNVAAKDSTCIWTQSADSNGNLVYGCHVNTPPNSAIFIIILSGVTIITTLPLKLINEYIVDEYASKRPNLDALGISSVYWLGSTTRHSAIKKRYGKENFEKLDHSIGSARAYFDQRHRKSSRQRNYVSKDILFHGKKALLSYQSPNEEVSLLLHEVKFFLTNVYPYGHIPSIGESNTISMEEYRILLKTISDELRISPYGTELPLTTRQQFIYRNHRNYIESRITQARKKSDRLLHGLKSFSITEDELMSKYLVQHFVLEQMPFFRRYCMSKNFFQFDEVSPDTIDPFIWGLAWLIIIGSMVFYMYWVTTWTKKLAGHTIHSWGLNFSLGVIQDVFFVQVIKVYIMNVSVVAASKPQLRNIHRTLINASLRLFDESTNTINLLQLHKESLIDNKLRIVQYLSGTCRVSRNDRVSDIFTARVLRTIDDIDIERCRDHHPTQMSKFILLFVIIPGIFGTMISDYYTKFVFDSIFISGTSGFLIFNAFLLHISPAILIIPYVVLITAIIWKFGLMNPLIRRHRKNLRNKQVRYWKNSSSSFTTKSLDIVGMMIYTLFYPFLDEKKNLIQETNKYWKDINSSSIKFMKNTNKTEIVNGKFIPKLAISNSYLDLNSIMMSTTMPTTMSTPITTISNTLPTGNYSEAVVLPEPIQALLPLGNSIEQTIQSHTIFQLRLLQPERKYIKEIMEDIESTYSQAVPILWINPCNQPYAQFYRDSHVTFDVNEALRRLAVNIQVYQFIYDPQNTSQYSEYLKAPQIRSISRLYTTRKDQTVLKKSYVQSMRQTCNYDGYHSFDMYCMALEGVPPNKRVAAVTGVWDTFHPCGKPLSKEERVEVLMSFIQDIEEVSDEDEDGVYFQEFEVWFLRQVNIIVKLREFEAAQVKFIEKRLFYHSDTGKTELVIQSALYFCRNMITYQSTASFPTSRRTSADSDGRSREFSVVSETNVTTSRGKDDNSNKDDNDDNVDDNSDDSNYSNNNNDGDDDVSIKNSNSNNNDNDINDGNLDESLDKTYVEDTVKSLHRHQLDLVDDTYRDRSFRMFHNSVKDTVQYLSENGFLQTDSSSLIFPVHEVLIILKTFLLVVLNQSEDEIENIQKQFTDWIYKNLDNVQKHAKRASFEKNGIVLSDAILWLQSQIQVSNFKLQSTDEKSESFTYEISTYDQALIRSEATASPLSLSYSPINPIDLVKPMNKVSHSQCGSSNNISGSNNLNTSRKSQEIETNTPDKPKSSSFVMSKSSKKLLLTFGSRRDISSPSRTNLSTRSSQKNGDYSSYKSNHDAKDSPEYG